MSGQLADDTSDWSIDGTLFVKPEVVEAYVAPPPTLRKGSSGEYVKLLQSKLGMTGNEIDGDFGNQTETMLKVAQAAHHLTVDGVAGPMSWKAWPDVPRLHRLRPKASERHEFVRLHHRRENRRRKKSWRGSMHLVAADVDAELTGLEPK
jgi:hypothetical protein